MLTGTLFRLGQESQTKRVAQTKEMSNSSSNRQLNTAVKAANKQMEDRLLDQDATPNRTTEQETGTKGRQGKYNSGRQSNNKEEEMRILHTDKTLKKLGVKKIGRQSDRKELERINRMCSSICEEYLTDYGNQKRQWDDFWLYEPKTEEDAILSLERANQLGIEITIRGSGHSMNGSSLPKSDGLLLLTTGLNKVLICPTGEVDVGAGAQVLVVDEYIQKYGLRLPVVNDGGEPAPTVGGFICAGGFGVSSKEYGGFWNCVSSVRFWTPDTGIRTISHKEDDFWTLFGCGKPEGVILSAKLITLGQYTGGAAEAHMNFQYVEHPRRIWFTFLAPTRKTSSLRRALIRLDRDLEEYWLRLPIYEYTIKENGSRIPSDFFPNHQGSLTAMGVWGEVTAKTERNIHAIIERVAQFTDKETYARRYWQSELCTGSPCGGQDSIRSMARNQ